MGQTKGTADDAPHFGEERDRKNPDFSVVDVYAEEGEVWIQTGGMHEPYSVAVAEQIRDRLDSAIGEARDTAVDEQNGDEAQTDTQIYQSEKTDGES